MGWHFIASKVEMPGRNEPPKAQQVASELFCLAAKTFEDAQPLAGMGDKAIASRFMTRKIEHIVNCSCTSPSMTYH
jgi:hypothetical protein